MYELSPLALPPSLLPCPPKWTAVVEKHLTGLLKQLSVGAQDDLRGAVKDRLIAARAGVDGMGAKDSNTSTNGSSRFRGGGKDLPGGGLGEGVLEKNIGVPMVVVGCKADSLQSETFEQQQRLHFIQQNLRRFCLKCEFVAENGRRAGAGGGGVSPPLVRLQRHFLVVHVL